MNMSFSGTDCSSSTISNNFVGNYSKANQYGNFLSAPQDITQNMFQYFKANPKYPPLHEGEHMFSSEEYNNAASNIVPDEFAAHDNSIANAKRFNHITVTQLSDTEYNIGQQLIQDFTPKQKEKTFSSFINGDPVYEHFKETRTPAMESPFGVTNLVPINSNNFKQSSIQATSGFENSQDFQAVEYTNDFPQIPLGYKVYNVSVVKTDEGYKMYAPKNLTINEEDVSNFIKAATTGEAIFIPKNPMQESNDPETKSSSFNFASLQETSSSCSATNTQYYDEANIKHNDNLYVENMDQDGKSSQTNRILPQVPAASMKSLKEITEQNEMSYRMDIVENSLLGEQEVAILQSDAKKERNYSDSKMMITDETQGNAKERNTSGR